MNRRGSTGLMMAALVAAVFVNTGHGQQDPGNAKIGSVSVTVYHATDGDPATAGPKATELEDAVAERLRREERLRFKSYRVLGMDVQPLLRSYESWAQPLKPSNEVMVRFEAQGHPTSKTAILDLELWLARKKTVKTDARLEGNRPLFVLGPEWRGGRLIIAVALAQESKPAK